MGWLLISEKLDLDPLRHVPAVSIVFFLCAGKLCSAIVVVVIRKNWLAEVKITDQVDPDGICGTHLQIMVRTRGLGRALGHITGRGVGRGDRDDSDDAPKRRRLTTSARRQRVPMIVAHDEPMVSAPDVEADDTGANIPADTGTQVAEDEHEGFPGGPSDPSVLTQYADHVACSERPELKLSSHRWKVHSLGRPVPAIEGLVSGTGLSPLIMCSVDTSDQGLLSSFFERWHRETSSFHLPVGELTITLDDVSSLLHLPVVGDLHAFQPLHMDDAVQMLVDLLMVFAEAARAETGQCRGPYVRLQWERRCQAGHWTATARAYLLHLLGCTLFANKSATNVHVVYLEALRDLSQTGRYAWGVAALVHMYDQLNDASISNSRQLGDYITLLQCWIYEHFSSAAESTADQDYDEDSPHAYRWIAKKKTMKRIHTPAYREHLDRLWISDVCWISYGEHRPVRDFHLISCYSGSCDSLDTPRPFLLRLPIHGCRMMIYTTGGCTTQIIWFQQVRCAPCQRLHGLVLPHFASFHDTRPHIRSSAKWSCSTALSRPSGPTDKYPSRAPSTFARPTVEEPRHVVEVCHGIAERLERHLSLGVVTPGSSTHEVIEECLRMARSVT
ncbi:Protein MAIN-LIKE 1 [Glycine soja]